MEEWRNEDVLQTIYESVQTDGAERGRTGRKRIAVSRRFAVSRQLIYEWQQKQRDGSLQDPKAAQESQLRAEIAELHRKIGQLTMENEFLKKTLERLEIRYPKNEATPETKPSSKSRNNSKKVMVPR
jgi:transposase-like protein